ncbi:MAG TPA: IPT/TIG domain-containing protein [Solirubrobacterales bacterium]|nr:IPT/TIG domain-containing protein [Solirubrobacterales bacterium]
MSRSESGSSRAALLLAVLLFVSGLGMLAFSFLRPPATRLDGIDPARARTGDTVILRGAGFAADPAANIVLFGDRTARIAGASASQLTVEVPELALEGGQASSVAVRVIVGQSASTAVDVQVFRDSTAAVAAPAAVEGPPVETAEASAPADPPPAPAAGPRTKASRPSLPRATPAPPAAAAAASGALPSAAPPALAPAHRRFVLERTNVESTKRVTAGLEGFDTTGVDLKRAPDVVGRVDFEVSPPQVKPGDRFTVYVYLINDGRKDIKLKDMFVATSVNGRLVSGPSAPKAREVGPKKRAVIGAFSDTWRDTIATWAMDVTVTSDRGDIYKNQVAWK